MQGLAAILRQRVAELLADRAERDAVDDRAVAGFEPQPQMRLPDFVGINQLMRRQRDDRLRIAAAERTGAIERRREFRRHAARADRAVDEQFVFVARVGDILGQRAFHVGAKFRELFLAQRHARGHGVAAALHQQSVLHRLPHRLAEIDAARSSGPSRCRCRPAPARSQRRAARISPSAATRRGRPRRDASLRKP